MLFPSLLEVQQLFVDVHGFSGPAFPLPNHVLECSIKLTMSGSIKLTSNVQHPKLASRVYVIHEPPETTKNKMEKCQSCCFPSVVMRFEFFGDRNTSTEGSMSRVTSVTWRKNWKLNNRCHTISCVLICVDFKVLFFKR